MSRTFCGREMEIALLRAEFDAVAIRGTNNEYCGPRMVFVIAESGLGKSRLVQELYLRLSDDPTWNPSEKKYWPTIFSEDDKKILTEPEMKGSEPTGPPKFAWLGARWQPKGERNLVQRRSVLPELKSSAMVHAEIIDQFCSAWLIAGRDIVHVVKKEFVDESMAEGIIHLGELASSTIPFAGLIWKLGKNAAKLAAQRVTQAQSREKTLLAASQSEIDDVFECMHVLLNGKAAVPTILWLDDAQWIDEETMQFLHKLWSHAKKHHWPLLVIITHWEREWHEIAHAKNDECEASNLRSFLCQDGVTVLDLSPSDSHTLDLFVEAKLPGVNPEQRALLVAKSAGNFLTMTENVQYLIRNPMCFVGNRIDGPLNNKAMDRIAAFETSRQARVRQRFEEFDEAIKKVLGWSSHIGTRFLVEVVAEFSRYMDSKLEPENLLELCIDPYVVIGISSELTREFRDTNYHDVAHSYCRAYFEEEDLDCLKKIYRKHLSDWINKSFDSDANLIWAETATQHVATARSVMTLDALERLDLVESARIAMPLPEHLLWTDPDHVTSLRTLYLLVVLYWEDQRLARIADLLNTLERIDIDAIPPNALSKHGCDWLLSVVLDCQASRDYNNWFGEVLLDPHYAGDGFEIGNEKNRKSLTIRRRLFAELDTPRSGRDVALSLARTNIFSGFSLESVSERVDVLRRAARECDLPAIWLMLCKALDERASWEESLECFDRVLRTEEETLSIVTRLAFELDTPDSWMSVNARLIRVAHAADQGGHNKVALAKYDESLKLARTKARTGDSNWLMVLAVNLGKAARCNYSCGDSKSAFAMLVEMTGILDVLTRGQNSKDNLSFVIGQKWVLADIERSCGRFDMARKKYEESLELARELANEEPDCERAVALGLSRLADFEGECGRPDVARKCYEDCLDISRRLAADHANSKDHWAFRGRLMEAARFEQAHGSIALARSKYEEVSGLDNNIAVFNPYSDLDPKLAWSTVVESFISMAEFMQLCGDSDGAESARKKALATLELRIPEDEVGIEDMRQDLAAWLRKQKSGEKTF